ncbi:MAG: histidine phosphatase family protein [Candidatus Sericytochromatia bacterium]|nr:histidine phosphatase family protein [Candidatus Sericytochromatia bacterium]
MIAGGLTVLRHARVKVPRGVCYGAEDVPHSRSHTAEVAAAFVAQAGTGLPVRVRVSPRTRCRALWRDVAGHWALDESGQHPTDGARLAVVVDARVAEMDFGSWEGQAWGEIPEAEMTVWTDDFLNHRCGGRESVRMFLARMLDAWHEDRALGGPVLWVAHAGVLRGLTVLERHGWHLPGTLLAADWPKEALEFGAWQTFGGMGANVGG